MKIPHMQLKKQLKKQTRRRAGDIARESETQPTHPQKRRGRPKLVTPSALRSSHPQVQQVHKEWHHGEGRKQERPPEAITKSRLTPTACVRSDRRAGSALRANVVTWSVHARAVGAQDTCMRRA